MSGVSCVVCGEIRGEADEFTWEAVCQGCYRKEKKENQRLQEAMNKYRELAVSASRKIIEALSERLEEK